MHPEAMNAIKESLLWWQSSPFKSSTHVRVLELGSRNINGSPRELFLDEDYYVGVDIEPGPGVDVVANAAELPTAGPHALDPGSYDIAICAEVFEHTRQWVSIIETCWTHLRTGGLVICTAASEPRPPHSAVDGHNMDTSEWTEDPEQFEAYIGLEWYHNIAPDEMEVVLSKNFHHVEVDTHPRGDVYGRAIK